MGASASTYAREGDQDVEPPKESVSLASWFAIVLFALIAALIYRASVTLVPSGLAEDAFVLGLAAVLLAIALSARRSESLKRYWEIPFAFFVFAVAGFFGDGSVSPFQWLFVHDVLHQATTTNNPLASTVAGMVAAQVFGTAMLTIPILALTRASGTRFRAVFLSRPAGWWGLAVAVVVFAVFYLLVARGRTESFFPTHGTVSTSRLLSLTPALLVLVLLNGFREELWFRGLFLKKYGRFLSPLAANVLAGVIFTSFHVEVQYSASILVFLAYALVLGLVFGWVMQRTKSVWPSAILHAATDIPIFIVYLSYASS